jgi:hypothetical protein
MHEALSLLQIGCRIGKLLSILKIVMTSVFLNVSTGITTEIVIAIKVVIYHKINWKLFFIAET